MNNALVQRILLFAGIFVPLHALPPVLSDPGFAAALGAHWLRWIGLAYHAGFALSALGILLARQRYAALLVGRWRVVAVVACAAAAATAHPSVAGQLAGRLVAGACSALLLAAFYRDLKTSGRYDQLPAIFGISALLLESGALMSGLTVNQGGWHSALLLAVVLTLATLLPAIVGGEHAPEPAFAEVAKVDLSGSGAYMGAAVLAYAGFFLMLLALGALGAQPNGPIVSGFAIFSTAFAFSAGNLLPLERLGPFRTPRLLIAAGLGLSLVGSLVLWSAIREQAAVAIVCSTALVAFGNGLTISRCFQRATLVSPDGFSGALLTMACVMIVTISLSMAAGVLAGSFQGAQVVAFGLAFVVVTLFGGFGAVRVAGL